MLALIHALSYVEGRHRWAIEPPLLLLTARGFVATARALGSPAILQRGPLRSARKRDIAPAE